MDDNTIPAGEPVIGGESEELKPQAPVEGVEGGVEGTDEAQAA